MLKPEHKAKLKDQLWRLNNLYYITNKEGKQVKFKMTLEQLEYFENEWTRNIILKARQLGFTTEMCMIQLDAALFMSDKCALIAHTLHDAKRLFREKVKYAYDRLPHLIKAANPLEIQTKDELVFSKGGSITVSTSFRGGTLDRLHVSEFGKICAKFPDKAREIVTGAFEAVSLKGRITLESTAEGKSGYFYEFCQLAEKLLLLLFEQFLAARKALNEQYSKEDRALQDQNNAATLAGYGAMFGMMGAMLDNFGAKSSGAYKAAFALQKGFVLASAILNAKGAILAAWNDPSNTTIWQKMAAAAATAVQTNELMSAIQGVALSGFANGGQIRGAGTNTSDSIPIMASHEEFMIKAKSAKKIGLDNLNYMNRTGELPNREMNQYNAINSGGSLERTVSSSGQPVTIQVYVTDSGVSTNGANTQDQKQLGQMIGNAVRTIIRQEQRQGGLLSK